MTRHSLAHALSIAAALLVAGCGKPDAAALAKSDAALSGQLVEGELQAVATRAVMVGTAGPRAPACARRLGARPGEPRAVHWSPVVGPAKAMAEGDIWACEAEGAWTGVVFPAFGQDADECLVPVRAPREYQGPCRWGWMRSSDLVASTE